MRLFLAFVVSGLALAGATFLASSAFETERFNCERDYLRGVTECDERDIRKDGQLAGAVALAVLGVGAGLAIGRSRS